MIRERWSVGEIVKISNIYKLLFQFEPVWHIKNKISINNV